MFAKVRRVCARRFLLAPPLPPPSFDLLLHPSQYSGLALPRANNVMRAAAAPDGVTFFRKQTALLPPRSSLDARAKGGGLDTERVFLSLKYSPA